MDKILRNGVDLQGLKGFNGDAHFFEDVTTPAKVREYLDSFQEQDKLKGMKLLLAMLSKGKDIPEFFPDVVKNVVVKSIEVKKMVYIYLVHYADFNPACREIALLSINSFQKDMSGSNPLIRGLALRVMTSIRVHDIIQIQLLAVRKCATDSSPYVRKCAANAIPKIYSLDPEQLEHLKEVIEILLKDMSTMVLGSTVAAFNEVCPKDYALLHSPHRKLCQLLADMDEWTQVSVLEVLTRYVRNQFVDPAPGHATAVKLQAKQRSSAAVQGRLGSSGGTVRRRVVKKAFYSDEEDHSEEETVEVADVQGISKPELGSVFTGANADVEGDLDPDHRLVLQSSLPLLKSRNSGVVLAVCTLHHYCGTQSTSTTQQIAKALVRVLRNRREVQYVVLNCICAMARDRPDMFRPFLSDFFAKSTDPVFNRMLKLEILISLSCKDNSQAILKELQTYLKDTNETFVCTAVRAVGQVADADPAVSGNCMEGIMHLLLCSTGRAAIVRECVVVLRQLLQQNTKSTTSFKILRQLAKLLIIEGGMEEPTARSSIVWLVGEFHAVLGDACADILRILASGFVQECTATKTQILNLAIKLAVQLPEDENVQLLMTYVLEMARYDLDTDLRDRSRFMTAMMGLAPSSEGDETAAAPAVDEDALSELNEHAKSIMLATKLPPVTLTGAVDVEGIPHFTLGSLSSIVGHTAVGYEPLEPWPEVQPDPAVRDTRDRGVFSRDRDALPYRDSASSVSAGGDANLDDFYGTKPARRAPAARSSSSSSSSSRSASSSSGSDSESSSSGTDSSDGSNSSDATSSDEDSSSSGSSRGRGRRSHGRPSPAAPAASSVRSAAPAPAASTAPRAAARAAPPSPNTVGKAEGAGGQQKSVVAKQGVRKVAGGRSTRDAFGSATLIPTQATATAAGGVSGADELADFAVAMSSEGGGSFSLDGDDLLLEAAAGNGPAGVVAGLDTGLLVPAVPPSPQYVPSGGGSASPLSPMSLPGAQVAATGTSPIPSGMGQVALSGPYTGMMSQAAGAAAAAGKPNVMLGSAPRAAVTVGNTGLVGNQRMMMQPPLALTQQGAAATMGGAGTGEGAGILPGAPVLVEGEHRSAAKVLLRPEMGGGLAVSMIFRHGVPGVAYSGACSTLLVLRNVGDQLLRRVKVSFPVDIRRTSTPEVTILAPGQEVWIPGEIVLSSINGKQVKVDIRCDKGAYAGMLAVQDWDLLQPLLMKSSDFETLRARLGGLGEVLRSTTATALGLNENSPYGGMEMELVMRVQSALNVYLVQGAGLGELLFAGSVRKGLGEHRLLITILTTSDGGVQVRMNCEDPVLCNALGDVFLKMITA